MIRFEICPIVDFVIPEATNRFTAIGGVIIPMDVLMIMMIPRAIGESPIAFASGRKIGVIRRIIDCVSRNIPRNSRMTFMTSSRTILLLNIPIMLVATVAGMLLYVMYQANGEDRDTTRSTIDELTTVSLKHS